MKHEIEWSAWARYAEKTFITMLFVVAAAFVLVPVAFVVWRYLASVLAK